MLACWLPGARFRWECILEVWRVKPKAKAWHPVLDVVPEAGGGLAIQPASTSSRGLRMAPVSCPQQDPWKTTHREGKHPLEWVRHWLAASHVECQVQVQLMHSLAGNSNGSGGCAPASHVGDSGSWTCLAQSRSVCASEGGACGWKLCLSNKFTF